MTQPLYATEASFSGHARTAESLRRLRQHDVAAAAFTLETRSAIDRYDRDNRAVVQRQRGARAAMQAAFCHNGGCLLMHTLSQVGTRVVKAETLTAAVVVSV